MKRRFTTLAIAGAMAVTAMAPATVFASPANNQTTVGYTAGGTHIENINAVVIVPKDTMFDSIGGHIDLFDVTAMVYDATANNNAGGYVDVDADSQLPSEIEVSVESTNSWNLKSGNSSLTYKYYTGHYSAGQNEATEVSGSTLNGVVGTMSGENGSLQGNLVMDAGQTVSDADYGKVFTDVLTYTFTSEGEDYPIN